MFGRHGADKKIEVAAIRVRFDLLSIKVSESWFASIWLRVSVFLGSWYAFVVCVRVCVYGRERERGERERMRGRRLSPSARAPSLAVGPAFAALCVHPRRASRSPRPRPRPCPQPRLRPCGVRLAGPGSAGGGTAARRGWRPKPSSTHMV